MERLSLEYIAGLMDADGSFSIAVTKTRYNSRAESKDTLPQFGFVVNLRQVPQYRFILEDVQYTLGVGKIYEHKATSRTSTAMTSWQTTNHADTLAACRILKPYLRIKLLSCDLLIEALTLWDDSKGVRIGAGFSRPDWAKERVLELSTRMNPSQQKSTSRRNKELRMVKG